MTSSKPKALLRALFFSYLLSGVLLFLLSLALYKLKLGEAQINASVYVIYLASCLAGGLLAGKGVGSRRFFWGLLSGLLYFAVLFTVSWLMKRDAPPELSRVLTVMGCCALGGVIGGMFS